MIDALIAGDSLNFTTAVAEYPPANGWTLKYRLVPRVSGGTPIDITAAPAGDSYKVQVGPSVTGTWTAGDYGWAAWVEKTGERYTVDRGQITIKPDPSTMNAGVDTRSRAEQDLDAIRAVMSGKSSNAQKSYKIADRELQSFDAKELFMLESRALAEVRRERRAAGLPGYGNTIRVNVR